MAKLKTLKDIPLARRDHCQDIGYGHGLFETLHEQCKVKGCVHRLIDEDLLRSEAIKWIHFARAAKLNMMATIETGKTTAPKIVPSKESEYFRGGESHLMAFFNIDETDLK